MPLFTVLFILTGVLLTSVISGILGMAGGMVLMGMLVWVLPVQQAMVLHATSQFFANGARAFILREHLHTRSIKFYLMGLAFTFGVFCMITLVPNKTAVFALLGIGPFIPLALPKKYHPDFTRPSQAFFCGVIVTVLQLTGGVSGPLLSIFFQSVSMTRHEVVATKAFSQAFSHVSKFIYFALIVTQVQTAATPLPLWLYFAVIPVAIIGSHSSKYILNRLTDVQFYKMTQWTLWILGAFYLAKAAQLLMQGSP